MRVKSIFILALLFQAISLIGQIKITGKVTEGNEPIVFANVILQSLEGKIIKGTTTIDNGEFSLSAPKGTYNLRISFIGFIEIKKQVSLNTDIDLGTLILKEESSRLNEVVITSKKRLIEQKTDRLIFNVENSVSASGGDALDALKLAPAITIQNNQISMVGGEATRVMVDGRLIQLSGEELVSFLNSISADDIKKIEIITNPPAQYEASGGGGIINIVYKKGRRNSWKNTTSFSYNVNTYGYGTLRNNFSYNKNKIQLNASINTTRGSLRNLERSATFFPKSTWKVGIDSKDTRKNNSARLSINYLLSDNIEIGGQYLGSFNRPFSDAPGTTEFYNESNQLDSLLVKTEPRRRSINNNIYNAHIIAKLDTMGRKLTVDFDYFNYENKLEADALVNTFSPSGQFVRVNQSVKNITNQAIDNYSIKADMSHPIDKLDLSYGFKFSFINTKNKLDNFSTVTNVPILDTNLSNEFEYKENVQGFYVNASRKISDKWNLQAGLRIENTETRGFSETLNQVNKNSYTKLFPSVFVSYNKNDNNTFSFNYGRGINRPNYRDLNPFRSYVNSNVYSEGNPFIQPAFIDRFTFTHNYKGKFITSLYFSYTSDGFGTLFSAEPENNIQAVIRRNYYNGTYWQLSEMYNVRFTSWWKSQNYAHISGVNANVFEDLSAPVKNGIQFRFSTNNTFTLSENTSVQADFFYQPKSSSNIYELGTMYGLSLGVKKTFLKKQLQAAIFVNDIFDSASLNNLTSEVNGVKTIYDQNYSSRYLRFSLSYSFGNKKIKTRNRGFGNSEEQQRAN
ncbi:outer membrane beta-barrel protein [uncultured Tenacibaculum sp.]|uniref:outer membrane beta-barrel protein n=1 Tax=uncultured Tenacibaculum sp. TaxID=174713 RepID=UPI002622ADEB|nr:outer membrane beta-barrel protein [uncultured Tenacibaculum sp.]